MPISPIYTKSFIIPESAIDRLGHVNNVVYVQWMQDLAIEHYSSMGGLEPIQAIGAVWVVREHRVQYLLPAFAGERIEMRTWVESTRRASSLRKYEFVRATDGKMLVKGETDWVLVDSKSGRPRPIPPGVAGVFNLD